MAEKKGNTEKLKYCFDTSKHLEVFLPTLNNWFRVTARDFRSFNGKRRIQNEEYNGPIYFHYTNKRANKTKVEKDKIIGFKYVSVRRAGEDFLSKFD
jgi:hypothetical protein